MNTNAGRRSLRILLTGGRSPAALELARLFHAAGHRVFAAESAPYHLCRVSRCVEQSFVVPAPTGDPAGFARELRAIAVNNRIDLLIPVCEEIFHIARELRQFDGVCRVFAPPLEALERVHHKGSFIRFAESIGLHVPATVTFESPDDWLPLVDDPRFSDGIVLKPAYSRFASRTLFLEPDRGDSRSFAIKRQRQKIVRLLANANVTSEHPWVAQALLRGEEWCTYSVAHRGEMTAYAAYRSTFRAGRGASIHYEARTQPNVREWVRHFVKESRFTGQIAFDFIIAADGTVAPLECNPRTTSGVHLFGSDDRLAEAMLEPSELLTEGQVAIPSAQAGQGAMLSAAMLSFGLVQAVKQRNLREWLRAYRSSRDVVFRRDDPKPFTEQFRLLAWTRRIAREQGITLQQASTSDIEWNGER
ncbi:ATP-grasp domain-containing protein [Cohnella soli]|uniref:ATP-grasp domain-containing protein n=1 Tax=Cohnella soli TaxID=425005 RepID=A0ABW0HZX1_9BACL